MADLCVDIGNTRLKIGLFSGKELIMSYVFMNTSLDPFRDFLKTLDKGKGSCIISSVYNSTQEIISLLSEVYDNRLELNKDTPLPVINEYKTPESLGKDRLCAAIGAYSIYGGKPLLVIDAGTAITIDMVTENGTFLGGCISPGFRMRANSLNAFTDRLPVAELSYLPPFPPDNTEAALNAGIINGVIFETEGYIQRCKEMFPDISIVITGGDTVFFEKYLNCRIFAEPHLVLYGLHRILQYNAKI